MNLFFDTSALVKYFHFEEGTNEVIKLIENEDNTIYISELAIIEFYNVIYRRHRKKARKPFCVFGVILWLKKLGK